MNDNNLETFSLVWLDTLVNASGENIGAQQQLRTVINHVKTFKDIDRCEDYIRSLCDDDRIVLIVNGQLGRELVPHIHQLRQVSVIYIFSVDNKKTLLWINEFKKIQCVISQLDELVGQIRYDRQRLNHSKIDEPLSMSFFKENLPDEESTSGLNYQFVYSQLLIDCLLRMKSISNDREELITVCENEYLGNPAELTVVHEFKQKYSSDRALWWYTRDAFLSRLINKAFRVKNINLLFRFRFFIRDIARQLEQRRCLKPIRVYRSQFISNEELQILKDSTGELISINSFFSTYVFRKRALAFLNEFNLGKDLQRVLFEIDADPRCDGVKSFGNITSLSYIVSEQEILFMLGSIFRLVDIRHDENHLWIIRMTLCGEKDHQLKSVFHFIKKQSSNEEADLLGFGHLLIDMARFDEAEKCFRRLLHELPYGHRDTAPCYHALGNVSLEKGRYDVSLDWYHKSLEIKMRTLKSDDPSLASIHNSIAVVYRKKGDAKGALESYEKALAILQQTFGEDHPNTIACLNNMAIVCKTEKKYLEALHFCKKTLAIRDKYLPVDHPDLAMSHNNIGMIHSHLGQYDLALEHYHLSLDIYEKTLPLQHPLILMTLESIGNSHNDKGEFDQGLLYYEKAASIYRQLLPSTHPDLVQIEQIIRRISSKVI